MDIQLEREITEQINIYKQNAKDGEERERADNWSKKRSIKKIKKIKIKK